jgi:hypothetical protein
VQISVAAQPAVAEAAEPVAVLRPKALRALAQLASEAPDPARSVRFDGPRCSRTRPRRRAVPTPSARRHRRRPTSTRRSTGCSRRAMHSRRPTWRWRSITPTSARSRSASSIRADGRLSAELSAADPDLQRAVTAAIAADRGAATSSGGDRPAGMASQRGFGGDAGGRGQQQSNTSDSARRHAPGRHAAGTGAADTGVFA